MRAFPRDASCKLENTLSLRVRERSLRVRVQPTRDDVDRGGGVRAS